MPRMRSEIWDNYVAVAEKAGFVKEAAEESAELKKYKEDAAARVGSDSIETIEAMYGVKPDQIEGQEYTDCITEAAHPNSVIIAPSYDKLNGLVENDIERGNIMSNIALKPPMGTHTNHRYAASELMMELVRVGNEMDARNKEGLFKLADECMIELHDEISGWENRRNS